MTTANEVPDIPDLGGKIPDPWTSLIQSIGATGPDQAERDRMDAQLRVWILFADLRARQLEANAAKIQADSLNRSTMMLSGATVVLAIATVVLVWVTATQGGA